MLSCQSQGLDQSSHEQGGCSPAVTYLDWFLHLRETSLYTWYKDSFPGKQGCNGCGKVLLRPPVVLHMRCMQYCESVCRLTVIAPKKAPVGKEDEDLLWLNLDRGWLLKVLLNLECSRALHIQIQMQAGSSVDANIGC